MSELRNSDILCIIEEFNKGLRHTVRIILTYSGHACL